jgi:hypothetical protein
MRDDPMKTRGPDEGEQSRIDDEDLDEVNGGMQTDNNLNPGSGLTGTRTNGDGYL